MPLRRRSGVAWAAERPWTSIAGAAARDLGETDEEVTVSQLSQLGQRPNHLGAEWSQDEQVNNVDVFMPPR